MKMWSCVVNECYLPDLALRAISTSMYYNSHEEREEITTHKDWGKGESSKGSRPNFQGKRGHGSMAAAALVLEIWRVFLRIR